MKLIVAEKPDQGAKLAAPFPHKKTNGIIQIEPNEIFPSGAYVTWAVGHLCELIPPEEYDSKWKKWTMDTLPIIPKRFQHRVVKTRWKQFNKVKEYVHRQDVDEIIIAGDAEREGEAIVRIILLLCKNNKPMKRLWISSLTKKAVEHGFKNLLKEEDTRNIYYEAISRACADWLVGINASRAYTLLLQKKGISDVFSTGRVQTPTLALIVKREEEISNFKSEPFWEVNAKFDFEGKKFTGKWHKDGETRIKDKNLAEKIMQFCKQKQSEIMEVKKDRKEYQPPFLFNLSSLQATANKLYRYSPKKTLDIAQKLYLKGIISYPRSDSNFVTKGEAAQFPDTLKKLSNISTFKEFFPLPIDSIYTNKRYVNEKKVKDHYAIIPTEQVTNPSKLQEEEAKIYSLIVKRLIAAHYNKAVVDVTTVQTIVDHRATFVSKGKVTVDDGWRRVFSEKSKPKKINEGEQELPTLQEGEQGFVDNVTVKESKTQPPKRYTEGDLITLMKTAGKHIYDEQLIKVLNSTEGLGTEATRAGIIGVLKDRGYIQVNKNQVYATDKGRLLINVVGESILASPEMTAKWEQRLTEIGDGKASAKVFMEQAKKLSEKLIEEAIHGSASWDFNGFDIENIIDNATSSKKWGNSSRKSPLGSCKKCDGKLIDKGSFYGCSQYTKTKCNFTLSKKILGKTISQSNIKKLLKGEKTDIIKGFKKGEKVFDAYLIWNKDTNQVEFKFN
ncbi:MULTISPECIES: DNA topoisomerase III [Bacillaceae]|uniref:DNA topoisomerase n=1 Tax=Evansella alkalicola TaxID=745819 RepID=A0ABS6JU32_9BACI|nr:MULTISPECIES: DNA topoisomerase III [Bacillaceae]MBU9722072.1 DNA topoisomerase III [Bacillus alkalicola]